MLSKDFGGNNEVMGNGSKCQITSNLLELALELAFDKVGRFIPLTIWHEMRMQIRSTNQCCFSRHVSSGRHASAQFLQLAA